MHKGMHHIHTYVTFIEKSSLLLGRERGSCNSWSSCSGPAWGPPSSSTWTLSWRMSCRPWSPNLSGGRRHLVLCQEFPRIVFVTALFFYFVSVPLDEQIANRWARRMEDEDIAPNTFSWSSRYGQKVAPYTDWIRCMHLAQYPRLPFCGLIYIQ